MTNAQPLDNLEITVKVLRLDPEMLRTALIGHVLQSLVDEGTITFPIRTPAELEPLFERANNTPFPEPGSTENLQSPQSVDLLPNVMFPIGNLDDFLLKTLAFVRFIHAIAGEGKIG